MEEVVSHRLLLFQDVLHAVVEVHAALAMAMPDRVVDGAAIVKLKGKSYRVHRKGEEPTDQ